MLCLTLPSSVLFAFAFSCFRCGLLLGLLLGLSSAYTCSYTCWQHFGSMLATCWQSCWAPHADLPFLPLCTPCKGWGTLHVVCVVVCGSWSVVVVCGCCLWLLSVVVVCGCCLWRCLFRACTDPLISLPLETLISSSMLPLL